jgi:adenylyl-sulfate kinase
LTLEHSSNVTWQDGNLSRAQRWQSLGVQGATVWLTGLPASGKSTIGAALEERLVTSGRFAYLLDGDNMRHGLCGDLGFSDADRAQNVARVGELARMFADSGAIAVVALVSPIDAGRRAVRESHVRCGLPFIEVFVDTPLEMCIARDPKALYAKAQAGEIHGFTGIDAPYEPPSRPDLRFTPELEVPAAVGAVLELLDICDEPVKDRSEKRLRAAAGSQSSGIRLIHKQNGVQT